MNFKNSLKRDRSYLIAVTLGEYSITFSCSFGCREPAVETLFNDFPEPLSDSFSTTEYLLDLFVEDSFSMSCRTFLRFFNCSVIVSNILSLSFSCSMSLVLRTSVLCVSFLASATILLASSKSVAVRSSTS